MFKPQCSQTTRLHVAPGRMLQIELMQSSQNQKAFQSDSQELIQAAQKGNAAAAAAGLTPQHSVHQAVHTTRQHA